MNFLSKVQALQTDTRTDATERVTTPHSRVVTPDISCFQAETENVLVWNRL